MATTPLCRCRVLYIGSSVPTLSKDGLQGIQEPLRQLYPADGRVDSKGIDCWLSVWVNGLVLEYTDGQKELFFPIQTLHYCAAVRFVNVSGYAIEGGGNEKFLPLDSPFANLPDTKHPPMFAAILRRTTGVKVLECHAFICTNVKAANALVRCCFHAYADSMYYMELNENNNETNTVGGERGQRMKAIKAGKSGQMGDSSSRSSSPVEPHRNRTNDRNRKQAGESDSDGEEILRWSDTKSKEKSARNGWQKRQQAGDYETASISSSVVGRYKKKTPSKQYIQQSPRKAPSESGIALGDRYSTALVPYGPGHGPMPHAIRPTGTGPRRRAYSEMDLYASAAAAREADQLVPYGAYPPPPIMPMPFPPHPFMFPGPPPHARFPPPHLGPPGPPGVMFGPPPPPRPMLLPPPPPPFARGPPPHPGMGPMHMPLPMAPSPFSTMGRPPMPPPHPHMMQMMEPAYSTLPRGVFPHPAMGPPYGPGPFPNDYPDQSEWPRAGYESYGAEQGRRPRGRKSSTSSSSRHRSDSEDGQDGMGETRATIEHHSKDFNTGGGASGLFRKTYLNEKAFSTSIQKEKSIIGRDDPIDHSSPSPSNRHNFGYNTKTGAGKVKKAGSGSAVIDRDDPIGVDYTRTDKKSRRQIGREIEEDVHNLSLSDEPEESSSAYPPPAQARSTGGNGLRQHHMLY